MMTTMILRAILFGILLLSATLHEATAAPDTVRLSSPTSGASVSPDAVTFEWNALPKVRWYDLSMSLTADFTSHVDSQKITATMLVVKKLPAGRTLYWRLRAVDSSGTGQWSAPWNVMVGSATTGGISDTVKPLTELGTGSYRGYMGGLYPEGRNTLPLGHLDAGLRAAGEIIPRDTAGNIDPLQGKIVLLSVGMSNTTQEYSIFKTLADTFSGKNPRLVVIDGAQGGQTASIIADPTANFWTVIEGRLKSAGVSAQQVQAIWLKEANAAPTNGFPGYAQDLQHDLATIVRDLPTRYPNLKVVYLSSRIYGGWATSTLNPEMYAYESGLSVKWLIEQQITGDTSLAYDGANRRAPWLAWGPYLWANGLHPRLADGLIWEQGDFVADGTHPSTSGRLKVAGMLLNFFKSDTTARGWFLQGSSSDVAREGSASGLRITCYPNTTSSATAIEFLLPKGGGVRLEIFNMRGEVVAHLIDGMRNAGEHRIDYAGTTDNGWALAAGVYYCRLSSDVGVCVERFVVVR
jgi:hypothetical protein